MMNRLKELRKTRNMTQDDLGKEIGMTKRTIIAWENGERDIKSDKAQQLADFFGVDVAYLLGYKEVELSLEDLFEDAKDGEIHYNSKEDMQLIIDRKALREEVEQLNLEDVSLVRKIVAGLIKLENK